MLLYTVKLKSFTINMLYNFLKKFQEAIQFLKANYFTDILRKKAFLSAATILIILQTSRNTSAFFLQNSVFYS